MILNWQVVIANGNLAADITTDGYFNIPFGRHITPPLRVMRYKA
jgi:hypothetical protein